MQGTKFYFVKVIQIYITTCFFFIKPTLHYLKEKIYNPELELVTDVAEANFATETASVLKFPEMK